MMPGNIQCQAVTAIWSGAAAPPPATANLIAEDDVVLLNEDGTILESE